MTPEVLADVLAEFEWPAPYTLEEDLPDGIIVHFPKCQLYFVEGFESDMNVYFLSVDTGTRERLHLGHALLAIRSDPTYQPPAVVLDLTTPVGPASLEKVKHGIRNLCTKLLTYIPEVLQGDFGWVEKYKAHRAKPA